MEFWLLAKVGFWINTAVNVGYGFAGFYAVKTGVRYVKDYKESVSREREEVK